MDVHLSYAGELLSANRSDGKVAAKGKLRRHFSDQLWELAIQEDRLWPEVLAANKGVARGSRLIPADPALENGPVLGVTFGNCLYAPLVSEKRQLVCHLDVTLLQRRQPGAILQGGDLDNRLKTLFEALRVPQNENEVIPRPKDSMEPNWFVLCLLEDDALITRLTIRTDRLLEPRKDDESTNHVRLNVTASLFGRHTLTDWMGQP